MIFPLQPTTLLTNPLVMIQKNICNIKLADVLKPCFLNYNSESISIKYKISFGNRRLPLL